MPYDAVLACPVGYPAAATRPPPVTGGGPGPVADVVALAIQPECVMAAPGYPARGLSGPNRADYPDYPGPVPRAA